MSSKSARPGVMGERSLLIDDAAQVLGVSRRTIYYRIRDGKLKTIRTRCGSQRVLVSSIEALLRERARVRARRRGGSSKTEALPFQVESLP
jgi:excisionase family DNA binding protein